MSSKQRLFSKPSYAAALRRELCLRAASYAVDHKLSHVPSYGELPAIVFEGFPEEGRHGNFYSASYKAILADDSWRRRLQKVHTSSARALPRSDKGWRELDSCTSSDALLMNVFCHPYAPARAKLRSVLGVSGDDPPKFGVKARVPLQGGRTDQTEIDMEWGGVLFEAKLTESDFQVKEAATVQRYRDLEVVFYSDMLPVCDSKYLYYQLIRNVLAAYASGREFCVLLDSRRPDLCDASYEIFRSIACADLRTRCKVFTWQELAAFLPRNMKQFLDLKYGIVSPGDVVSDIPLST